ncbi:hypothetical protein L7F22_001337 [Adiantum nelumboides]|nr:hypothetical protein [Adiantum nelumboides]
MDYYAKRMATCASDVRVGRKRRCYQPISTLATRAPSGRFAWARLKFGPYLASCSYDPKACLWKENPDGSWAQAFVLSSMMRLYPISFTPYELGFILACGSSDGACVGVASVSWSPAAAPGSLIGPYYSPVQKLVSGGCDNTVKVWKFADGQWKMDCFPPLSKCHIDWVRDVAWAPNLGLPSVSQDGTAIIGTQGKDGQNWEGQVFKTRVWRVSWSHTGNILAVADGNNNVTLWKEAVDTEWTSVTTV